MMTAANFWCPDCRQPVIRARTEAMAWQLLNPEPDDDGNVHAYEAIPGNWYARSVKPRTPAVAPDRLMMPHKATCPAVDRTPKDKAPAAAEPAPQNVTSLDAWRKAAREHAAGQRRDRPRLKAGGYRPGMNVTRPRRDR